MDNIAEKYRALKSLDNAICRMKKDLVDVEEAYRLLGIALTDELTAQILRIEEDEADVEGETEIEVDDACAN